MTRYTIVIEGPMPGKGRARVAMRGGVARAYTPATTVNAEAHVRACALRDVGQPMLAGPVFLDMRVMVAVPRSWSKRHRAEALQGLLRPTSKPDCSNMLKLVEDALNGLIYADDAQIVEAIVTKHYGPVPKTTVVIRDYRASAVITEGATA